MRRRPLRVLLALAVLFGAACGGDDGDAADATTTTSTGSPATTEDEELGAGSTTATSAARAGSTESADTPKTGQVGDRLVTDGFEQDQERIAMTVIEIIDPADDMLHESNDEIPENQRAVVVKTEFTNLGPNPYDSAPDLYLVTIDDRPSPTRQSIAVVKSCPAYGLEPIAPGATVSGCTVFLMAEAAPVVSVQWSPRPDLTDRTLTWTK